MYCLPAALAGTFVASLPRNKSALRTTYRLVCGPQSLLNGACNICTAQCGLKIAFTDMLCLLWTSFNLLIPRNLRGAYM